MASSYNSRSKRAACRCEPVWVVPMKKRGRIRRTACPCGELGMRIVWTPEAQQDRSDVWDYITADSPSAAARMDELFSDAAARLAQHPMLGQPR